MNLIPRSLRLARHLLKLKMRFPKSCIQFGVTVDDKSVAEEYSVLFKNSLLYESNLGKYSYVQENTSIYFADVGPFCSIAKNVTIGLFEHPTHMISTSPVFYDNTQPLPRIFVDENMFKKSMARTEIGADVWIGEGVKIRSGVRIGVGSVIGAGSIVTRDVDPYTVSAGVPCRSIKRRFEDVLCERLLASRWWELDEKELLAFAPYYEDPFAFLNAVEKGL